MRAKNVNCLLHIRITVQKHGIVYFTLTATTTASGAATTKKTVTHNCNVFVVIDSESQVSGNTKISVGDAFTQIFTKAFRHFLLMLCTSLASVSHAAFTITVKGKKITSLYHVKSGPIKLKQTVGRISSSRSTGGPGQQGKRGPPEVTIMYAVLHI